MATWKTFVGAIIALPGTVLVMVPAAILILTGTTNVGWSLPAPWSALPRLAGLAAAGVGAVLAVRSASLFATIGRGTPAPWAPPQRLVVSGIYRSVRNPMITGAALVLLGETLVFGSWPLVCWFVLFAVGNTVYIPLFEEPRLARRYGGDYALYRKNVPRWIPRSRPWNGPSENGDWHQRSEAETCLSPLSHAGEHDDAER